MNALRELLTEVATRSGAEGLDALREVQAADPEQSRAAAALHARLQGYFALDEDARICRFASALRHHRGAAALGADGEAASLASSAGSAVKADFEAVFDAVTNTNVADTEIELSLAWTAVECSLLDRVEQQADVLAFAHGLAARYGHAGAARQLAEPIAAANGAELFVPLRHKPAEAGLRLIPDQQWDDEREHVMAWLTLGGEDPPAWAAPLEPIATLPADVCRRAVLLEGPLAGAVLYADDAVHQEEARYASGAHFIAATCLCPEQVLALGGYVSSAAPDHAFMLYPEACEEGTEGDCIAGTGQSA